MIEREYCQEVFAQYDKVFSAAQVTDAAIREYIEWLAEHRRHCGVCK